MEPIGEISVHRLSNIKAYHIAKVVVVDVALTALAGVAIAFGGLFLIGGAALAGVVTLGTLLYLKTRAQHIEFKGQAPQGPSRALDVATYWDEATKYEAIEIPIAMPNGPLEQFRADLPRTSYDFLIDIGGKRTSNSPEMGSVDEACFARNIRMVAPKIADIDGVKRVASNNSAGAAAAQAVVLYLTNPDLGYNVIQPPEYAFTIEPNTTGDNVVCIWRGEFTIQTPGNPHCVPVEARFDIAADTATVRILRPVLDSPLTAIHKRGTLHISGPCSANQEPIYEFINRETALAPTEEEFWKRSMRQPTIEVFETDATNAVIHAADLADVPGLVDRDFHRQNYRLMQYNDERLEIYNEWTPADIGAVAGSRVGMAATLADLIPQRDSRAEVVETAMQYLFQGNVADVAVLGFTAYNGVMAGNNDLPITINGPPPEEGWWIISPNASRDNFIIKWEGKLKVKTVNPEKQVGLIEASVTYDLASQTRHSVVHPPRKLTAEERQNIQAKKRADEDRDIAD